MKISDTSPPCRTPDNLMLATEFPSTTGQVEAANAIGLKRTKGPPSTPYGLPRKKPSRDINHYLVLFQLVSPQRHQWDRYLTIKFDKQVNDVDFELYLLKLSFSRVVRQQQQRQQPSLPPPRPHRTEMVRSRREETATTSTLESATVPPPLPRSLNTAASM
ncbi:hypothetical protein SK128_007950 [Halocaridina rubra]|uniref:Uncharacterized protein n=1 Tax=Halocaridina rubra TaxID=373956 RepID=A0AAN8X9U9_HALRR